MTQKGIFTGVSWEEYRAIDLPSPSLLKHGLRSMRRLKRAIDGEIPGPAANVTAVGNAVHCMIADEFDERFAVMPEFEKSEQNLTAGTLKKKPAKMRKADGSLSSAGEKWEELRKSVGEGPNCEEIRTGQEKTESKLTAYYQESKDRFALSLGNREALTTAQHNTAKKAYDQIMACDEARELIVQSNQANTSEVVVIGEIDGVMVKTRMDGLLPSHGWDLKTTSDIEPHAFYRKFKQMDYGFQFACHWSLLLSNRVVLDQYSVIAAETQDDFDVGVIRVPAALFDIWMERAERLCASYRKCKETGIWPGLYSQPEGLMVPQWDLNDDCELEGFDD